MTERYGRLWICSEWVCRGHVPGLSRKHTCAASVAVTGSSTVRTGTWACILQVGMRAFER
jgi:hypothetical protein